MMSTDIEELSGGRQVPSCGGWGERDRCPVSMFREHSSISILWNIVNLRLHILEISLVCSILVSLCRMLQDLREGEAQSIGTIQCQTVNGGRKFPTHLRP
jgi:hypothetical protein